MIRTGRQSTTGWSGLIESHCETTKFNPCQPDQNFRRQKPFWWTATTL